ncbi:MAG: hypothetical protein ABIQ35_15690 [Verrucomicrobiota bacterium]
MRFYSNIANEENNGHSLPVWELLLVFVLCVIPLLAGKFLPLIDLPQHLAMAKAIVALLDGDAHFSHYYELDLWPQPYWLYYILVGIFSKFVSIEMANKLVMCAYSVGITLGVRSLLVAFGRDMRWWVLAVPLAWSTSFFYAFMAYLVGVPLVLFGIAALETSCSSVQMPRKWQWYVVILSCLIYLAHAQAYLWFLLSAAVLLFIHWRGFRWCVRVLFPLTPSFVIFGVWVWRTFGAAQPVPTGQPSANYGSLWNLGMHWEPFTKRITGVMEQLYGGCTDGSNRWLGWLWLGLIVGAIALAEKDPRLSPTKEVNAGRKKYQVEILLAAFLLAWLVLPYDVSGQWYLAPRYLLFSGAMAIVAAAHSSIWHRRLFFAGVIVSVAFSINVARVINQFQPAMFGLFEVLKAVPPGERIAHFPFDERNTIGPDGHATNGIVGVIDLPTSVSAHGYIPALPGSPEGWMSPTHHAAAYYQVWLGGDIATSFAAAPTNPVRYRPGMKPGGLIEYEPENVDMDVAVKDFGWFLVRGTLRGKATRLGEYAELVAASGSWELWRRR